MSIPKQPRQLMINLMYLVLTAMLALNVSSEIFQAFKVINKELEQSNLILKNQSDAIPARIKRLVRKDPDGLQQYADKAAFVQRKAQLICDSIDAIVNYMIDRSGNDDGTLNEEDFNITYDEFGAELTRKIKGEKNKDITTRFLVGPEPAKDAGKGRALQELINIVSDNFLEVIDEENRAYYQQRLALSVDSSWVNNPDKLNWSHYNFYQMPLAATLPIFNKIKNDARASETMILNYLLEQCGGDDNELTNFRVIASARKNYVINNEKYEADLFLGAYNKVMGTIAIKVDGHALPVRDGQATYSKTTDKVGRHKYTAEVTITNPVTGEVTTEKEHFEYEVGERFCNVAAEKMNVFYIGADNPVSIVAAGVPSGSLKIQSAGVDIDHRSGNSYSVHARKPGNAFITVSGDGLPPTKFPFRVKRIPNPVPVVGGGPGKKGGRMKSGEFKAQQGLAAILESFDFDAKCKVMGYRLTRVADREDPVDHLNQGGRFDRRSMQLINRAEPGDIYYFDEIKAKCPGDITGRKLPSIVFRII